MKQCQLIASGQRSVDTVKRLLFAMCLLVCAAACGCHEGKERLSGLEAAGESPPVESEAVRAEMKLYFRNNNYSRDPESLPVIPVTRLVSPEEITARAVLEALIAGPSPGEELQYGAGPVINGSELHIEDVYIKNKICVVRLQSPHPLPLYNYAHQSPALAEAVLAQSLLRSLGKLLPVEAVWLFHNGSPWQSGSFNWLCPLAPHGAGVGYTLYFCADQASYYSRQGLEFLTPVQVRLEASGQEKEEEGVFARIIALLSQDYDPAHRAALPQGIKVRDFTLAEHQLLIDLAAPFSGSPEEARAFVGALVYTFTGLPEIDAVQVTVMGQTWESGGIAWPHPLSREDLKRDLNLR